MTRGAALFTICRIAAAALVAGPALAQQLGDPSPGISLDGINNYVPKPDIPTSQILTGEVVLAAQLTADSPDISRGISWRVYRPEPDDDGKLPLVAHGTGGNYALNLEPGSYLVHAAFGRAGATKRITVGLERKRENLVLDAGGLQLQAFLAGGGRIRADKLSFSIYEAEEDARGNRALVVKDVSPGEVVRLNAGTYHVVSQYGDVNASIRSDIRVEAGKLTEATVEHKAAEITLKLVRDQNGEAIADTSWSILTDNGDIVEERVGAFASMVLAEGNYTAVANNRDRIYQQDFEVVGGRNDDVEVLATNPTTAAQPVEGDAPVDEGSGDDAFE